MNSPIFIALPRFDPYYSRNNNNNPRFVREISQKSSNNYSIMLKLSREMNSGFHARAKLRRWWRNRIRIPVSLAAVHSISRKLGRETKSRGRVVAREEILGKRGDT